MSKNAMCYQKALGAFVGLHAGDSLGATLEFCPPQPSPTSHCEILGGGEFNWRAGQGTDDTDLMLCVLRSIVSPNNLDLMKLKSEFLIWYRSNPPDIGHTTRRGMQRLEQGLPLAECGPRDELAQGNGSLMRAAPLCLLEEQELERVLETQCRMTHGHENCVVADRVYLHVLRALLHGADKKQAYLMALDSSKGLSKTLYEMLLAVPQMSWSELNSQGHCFSTLQVALWGLYHTDNFVSAVVHVVNRGGDADTAGAVTGALAGALYGYDAIPHRWRVLLELRQEIETELDRLFA
ncbi:MAG: ADP-ribosylglycohydrolase family protein [Bdellovibrionaceae bacterium]|nr:ADP-ribosylglycohydrolase family protein [Pseudobdellovibrionaceae bacterium]